MNRRRSKRGRKQGATQPPASRGIKQVEEIQRQGFIARHSGALGVVLTALALIVSIVALYFAFVGPKPSRVSDLSITGVKATTKTDVPVTVHGPMGDDSSGSPLVTSAVAITLKNSGEQAALIKKMRLTVDRVWAPRGCDGAGPTTYTVAYDFVLPGDIESRTLPFVKEKDYQFQVAGQEIEGLLIPIGQESFGEAAWPLVIAGTLELLQDDRKPLKTEAFVLMDGHRNDDIVRLSNESRGDASSDAARWACVEKNLAMLKDAFGRSNLKSSSIADLLERIKPKQASKTQGPTRTNTNEIDANTWIAQLASFPSSTSNAELVEKSKEISSAIDLPVKILSSSDFASLNPGYWVVYRAGGFKNGHEALEACRKAGRTDPASCTGRYLSHREADRDLVCRFSDPQDARRCNR